MLVIAVGVGDVLLRLLPPLIAVIVIHTFVIKRFDLNKIALPACLKFVLYFFSGKCMDQLMMD